MPLLRTRSIRARLLIGILATLVLILGSAAWWSYEVAKHESEELFGARLATSARVLDALIARQVEHATISNPLVIALPKELETASGHETALGHPYETKIAFQVWGDDGRLLVRSMSAPARAFAPNVAGFSSEIVDGQPYHVFVLRSTNTWIHVAEKYEVRDELIHDLGVAVMTPLIVGAALLLVIVNGLVLYALRPLRQLAGHIEERQPDSLGPVALRDVPRELAPVVRALNDLLQRVALAFEHERRFTDAAAHELRTPIAALKIHAENIARAQSDEERAQSMRKLRQSLDRTAKLATQMLEYSRTQNAVDHEHRVRMRLGDIVRETSAAMEPMRESKSQQLELIESPSARNVWIEGEPAKIQRLIANLLDNASRYAPEESTIEVTLRGEPGAAVLAVANAGPAIPPDLRERVFEPYYRVPGSPSEGSGLGLAIVKEIAAQHGASLALSSLDGAEGTRVTVTFPAIVEPRAQLSTAEAAAPPSAGAASRGTSDISAASWR